MTEEIKIGDPNTGFVCTRCHRMTADGWCFDFGHEEVFGQILGQCCAECCWAVLGLYRDRAEDMEALAREVATKVIRELATPERGE